MEAATPMVLPVEIVKVVFELASVDDETLLSIAQVCTAARHWINAVVYRNVRFNRMEITSAFTSSVLTEDSATHVKELLITTHVAPEFVDIALRSCTKAEELFLWHATTLFSDISAQHVHQILDKVASSSHLLRLERLFIHGLNERHFYGHFQSITHLSTFIPIANKCCLPRRGDTALVETMTSLSKFPNLTHVAFTVSSVFAITMDINSFSSGIYSFAAKYLPPSLRMFMVVMYPLPHDIAACCALKDRWKVEECSGDPRYIALDLTKVAGEVIHSLHTEFSLRDVPLLPSLLRDLFDLADKELVARLESGKYESLSSISEGH